MKDCTKEEGRIKEKEQQLEKLMPDIIKELTEAKQHLPKFSIISGGGLFAKKNFKRTKSEFSHLVGGEKQEERASQQALHSLRSWIEAPLQTNIYKEFLQNTEIQLKEHAQIVDLLIHIFKNLEKNEEQMYTMFADLGKTIQFIEKFDTALMQFEQEFQDYLDNVRELYGETRSDLQMLKEEYGEIQQLEQVIKGAIQQLPSLEQTAKNLEREEKEFLGNIRRDIRRMPEALVASDIKA